MKWLKRITDYYRDKVLAEKCCLEVKDVCVHEWSVIGFYRESMQAESVVMNKCKICGEFYR